MPVVQPGGVLVLWLRRLRHGETSTYESQWQRCAASNSALLLQVGTAHYRASREENGCKAHSWVARLVWLH